MGGMLAECIPAQKWVEAFCFTPGRLVDAGLTRTIGVIASLANKAREETAALKSETPPQGRDIHIAPTQGAKRKDAPAGTIPTSLGRVMPGFGVGWVWSSRSTAEPPPAPYIHGTQICMQAAKGQTTKQRRSPTCESKSTPMCSASDCLYRHPQHRRCAAETAHRDAAQTHCNPEGGAREDGEEGDYRQERAAVIEANGTRPSGTIRKGGEGGYTEAAALMSTGLIGGIVTESIPLSTTDT